MNRWDRKGVPHGGWTCIHIEDMGEPCHTCEMCGQQEIRFVHTMRHDEYIHELDVGCVCAMKMDRNYDGKAAERWLVNRTNRQFSFVHLGIGWKWSRKGNQYWRRRGQVVIMGPRGQWVSVNGTFLRGRFANETAARQAAFDIIDPADAWCVANK